MATSPKPPSAQVPLTSDEEGQSITRRQDQSPSKLFIDTSRSSSLSRIELPWSTKIPRLESLEDDGENTQVGILTLEETTKPDVSKVKHPYLTIISGYQAGEMFRLSQEETILGRGSKVTISIDSEGVSRTHARIEQRNDQYILEDLKSTNGTWVEERRIDTHTLTDGEQIRIGTEVIVRFGLYNELEAALQRQLYESAVRDPLTQTYNRSYFQERLKTEIAYALRHKTTLSLILLDVDFFKRVNDTYGHPAGDVVLRTISVVIRTAIRAEDVFARIGGEEFALLVRGVDLSNTMAFAERLRRGIERLHIRWQEHVLNVTASFGVALIHEAETGEALISCADKRLYEAKAQGRNRVVGV